MAPARRAPASRRTSSIYASRRTWGARRLRPAFSPSLRSVFGVSTHSREPMPCSGRPSKERRAAPPFPVWRGIPQSSPMVAPV